MAASATFASHGELHVKWVVSGYDHRLSSVDFGIQALNPLHDAARIRARSTSHAVAARNGCTKIPLSAGRAQEDETILENGVSDHAKVRFV
jgi:hypothetical protein